MTARVQVASGVALWTTVSGNGEPVVLLNGGPGMADYLGPVAALLDDTLCSHRFEARGCGRSSDQGPFTLATFVEDIEALREHWGHASWYVLGHSWGVDLALAYALAYPQRVRGVIGIAGGRVHNDRAWHAAYASRRDAEDMPPAAGPPNLAVNSALNAEWRAYCKRPELLRRVAESAVSAVFLYGADDIRPAWPTEQLAALLPRASFRRIDGADHHIWQNQPGWLRREIEEFVVRTSRDEPNG